MLHQTRNVWLRTCVISLVAHVFVPAPSTVTSPAIGVFGGLLVTVLPTSLQRRDWLVGVVERGSPERGRDLAGRGLTIGL